MSLYDELGLGPNATQEEVERAGRKRVRETHPDAGGDAEAFDRTMRALTVLRDPLKRERYDQTGETSDEPENLRMAQAMAMVSGRFQDALSRVDVARHSPLDAVRMSIEQEIAQARSNIRETEALMAKLAQRIERLELKDPDKPNWLKDAVNHKIREYELGIARVQSEIGIREVALEILKDFGWRLDPPPPQPTSADLMRQYDEAVRRGLTPRGFFRAGP